MLKKLKASHLFAAGLILRIGLLPFFGSQAYMRDLFIPFIDFAVTNPFSNPWAQFPSHFFPYGSVLFVLLFIPKLVGYWIFGQAALGVGPLSLALMKLPLLGIDILMLGLLQKLSGRDKLPLVLIYWLNPVLIFITYIHGQLDIASMFFAILALYLLLRQKPVLSGFVLALSALCKFHVAVIIPLILVYMWRIDFPKAAIRKMSSWAAIFGLTSVIGFLPLLLTGRFLYVTVSSPQANRLYGMQIQMGPSQILLIGLGLVLLTLARLCLSRQVTYRGMLFGSGIVFGLLLLVTNPGPGWFFWVFPFLCLFYVTYLTNHPLLFAANIVSYLIYFGGIEFFPNAMSPFLSSIPFTLMQASLAAILAEVWLMVIRPEMPLLSGFKPLMIGIAGDSGSGKNILSNTLADLMGGRDSIIMEGDDYHRWERGSVEWNEYTQLNPRANYLPTMASHISALILGRFVLQPKYDHSTGAFTSPRPIKPNRTIIVQGLHSLYLKGMRENFDLKIFLAPEPTVQKCWKVTRDVKERGYPLEKVLESIEKRSEDSKTHIDPQRHLADWIIEYFPISSASVEDVLNGRKMDLGVRYIFWNDTPVFMLTETLRTIGQCTVRVESIEGDIDRIRMTVTGEPSIETIRQIGAALFPDLRQITRSYKEPIWKEGLIGVTQLTALLLIRHNTLLHSHDPNH